MNESKPGTAPPQPAFCQFCQHDFHGTERCQKCRCKGKQKWWQKIGEGLGNAIGETLFGGER